MSNTQRDWSPFALLLIDVQKDFWSKEQLQNFANFPANVARLLTFCRGEGIEIVHLRASFKPDMSDWMAIYKLQGHIPCVEGTTGAEPLPCALDLPGETVVIKKTFDGFHNPRLARYLRRKGKQFILTAGLVTSICVLFTTVSAAQQGFLTAVVEDCCAAQPIQHKQALDTYKFIFDRTTVDLIPGRYSAWLADLKKLDKLPRALDCSRRSTNASSYKEIAHENVRAIKEHTQI